MTRRRKQDGSRIFAQEQIEKTVIALYRTHGLPLPEVRSILLREVNGQTGFTAEMLDEAFEEDERAKDE